MGAGEEAEAGLRPDGGPTDGAAVAAPDGAAVDAADRPSPELAGEPTGEGQVTQAPAPRPVSRDGPGRLVVGLVRGLHGLRGAVRVESLTDRPEERFAAGARLFAEGRRTPLTVLAADRDGPGWRLRFREVPDRTAADALRDTYLEAEVPPGGGLRRGEYWWHEVIGCAVRDVDGDELGTVADVYRAGGAEVLLVRGARGELDVPVVRSVVRIFAPRRGEIVVDGSALGVRGDAAEATEGAPEPARPRRSRRRAGAVAAPADPGAIGEPGEDA